MYAEDIASVLFEERFLMNCILNTFITDEKDKEPRLTRIHYASGMLLLDESCPEIVGKHFVYPFKGRE